MDPEYCLELFRKCVDAQILRKNSTVLYEQCGLNFNYPYTIYRYVPLTLCCWCEDWFNRNLSIMVLFCEAQEGAVPPPPPPAENSCNHVLTPLHFRFRSAQFIRIISYIFFGCTVSAYVFLKEVE
jgi:hypothetical protein